MAEQGRNSNRRSRGTGRRPAAARPSASRPARRRPSRVGASSGNAASRPSASRNNARRPSARSTAAAPRTGGLGGVLAVAEQLGPRTILLAALALVLLLGLLVFGLRGCHKPAANSGSYGTTYDWTCLSWEGDRLHYYSDTLGSRLGIDVSEVQGEIDWNAVSNDGIGFAMIRSGYRGIDGGVVNDDIYFEQNLQGAKNAHLDTGVYFYSQALTEDEAREEAKQVLQALNGRKLTLPVAYDFEKTSDGTGRADYLENNQIDANAAAFCDTIRKAGYEAVIYGNPSDLAFYSKSTLDKYGIWLAQYGDVPMLDTGFCIWQYSENGTVAGISTVVDLNLNIYSK